MGNFRENTNAIRSGFERNAWRYGAAFWLIVALAETAQAQTATSPTPSTATSPTGMEEIVVTASRAATAGYQAPAPTVVVSEDTLEQQQVTNVGALLDTLPAFKPTLTPGANGIRTQSPGSSYADLRGLGSQRTLVLIDGTRVVPQAPANNTGIAVSPDMNQVPSLMVQRVEVVTGGASAQWGSDAVGGVVNILLRNDFTGLEMKVQGGLSQAGDNGNARIGVLAGTDFAGDKGHVVFGFDATKNDGLGDINTRSWGREDYSIVTVPGSSPSQLVLSPNVLPVSTPGGLIISSGTAATRFSLLGYQFLPGGTIAPFNFGSNGAAQITTANTNKITATSMIGGQGQSLATGLSMEPSVQRAAPYVHANYDITDDIDVFVEAGYSYEQGKASILPSRDSADTISINNYFLTQLPQYNTVIKPAMLAAGITSFTLSRINYDVGTAITTIENDTPHGGVGAKGDFDDPWGTTWKWDSHMGFGENIYNNSTANDRIKANYTNAVNAVSNGAGGVTCASAAAVAAGCVPINIFGSGAPSAAALAYVTGTETSKSVYDQYTASANLKGSPFSTWAGPVTLATGFEYRNEHQSVTADPIATAGGYEASNAAPFSGGFDVKEGYFEGIVPLARDVFLIKSLDLDSAVRYADYSTVGGQTTWKEGLNYEMIDGLRFRATRSRDIRAPALYELYSPGSVSNLPVGGSPLIPTNTSVGNPHLLPEKADTYTVGTVIQPPFLPGFSLSVDYYDIKISQAITSLTAPTIDSLCLSGQTGLCQYVTGPLAAPTAVVAPVLNAAFVKNEGFDIAASYRMPVSEIFSGVEGKLDFGVNVTYTEHVLVNLGTGVTIDRAGENGQANSYALPHLRLNFTETYTDGPAALTAQVVVIGSGHIDNTYNTGGSNPTINNNYVPTIAYLNLFGSYNFGKNDEYQVFASVNNVLNQAPPALPYPTILTATNGSYYDIIGRAFQFGATYRF